MRLAAEYDNLIQPVIARAAAQPDLLTLVFIEENGEKEFIRAAQFHTQSLAYARALQSIGIAPGDLVVLVLQHCRELLYAFWGAMYLGAVPSIFPFLTEKLDPAIYMQRVHDLIAQEGVRAVITFPGFKDELRALLADVGCQVLATNDTSVDLVSGNFVVSQPDGERIAFLQHSSGTTGLQKGVALSHRAVLNQIDAYSEAIQLGAQDVIVSWLPLYHDMGLIASLVMPVVAGVPVVWMSPFHWTRSPKILMRAIHEHRGTLCWLPNFAYNHCVRAISKRDLEGLRLDSLRMVINCSEPCRAESHAMFLERFAPYGFREEALATCYAMAENTFAVTQSQPGVAPHVDWVSTDALQRARQAVPAPPASAGSTAMVSCGTPISGCEVAIADDHGNRLPERHVGEVILRSNSMLTEYYHRPDITAQALRDGWYFTGDMGYIADGHLYIAGRKKDLIIVGGKNIYPQDLEAIANNIPGIHPGRAVAFGVFDERVGSEAVVMVCELADGHSGEDEHREIERLLRLRVVQQSEITLSDVRLVGRKWLIKTSSGKISRAANREKYLAEFQPHA
ncbi:MAG: AMP-binding protein [Anaerolineae bacterium]|nr:AMP-binding protein [Anaerolineae bacterium]